MNKTVTCPNCKTDNITDPRNHRPQIYCGHCGELFDRSIPPVVEVEDHNEDIARFEGEGGLAS